MLSQGRALLPSPPRLPAQLSSGTASVFFPAVWEAEGESERAWRAPLCLFILLCRPAAKAVSGTVPVLTASAAAGAREACSRLFLGWLPVEGGGGGSCGKWAHPSGYLSWVPPAPRPHSAAAAEGLAGRDRKGDTGAAGWEWWRWENWQRWAQHPGARRPGPNRGLACAKTLPSWLRRVNRQHLAGYI